MNGTANQVEAQLKDLVERLAESIGRPIQWTDGKAAQKARKRSYYIAYHAGVAGTHATRLQEAICHLMHARSFEAATSTDGIEAHLMDVQRSDFMILLQTSGVMSQPYVLLAAYWATLHNIPIVCVVVEGSGYVFASAKQHLEHLSSWLDADALEQVRTVLTNAAPRHAASINALQSRLSNILPSLISVSYNPVGSANELAGTARDIMDKHDALVGVRASSFEQDPHGVESRRPSVLRRGFTYDDYIASQALPLDGSETFRA